VVLSFLHFLISIFLFSNNLCVISDLLMSVKAGNEMKIIPDIKWTFKLFIYLTVHPHLNKELNFFHLIEENCLTSIRNSDQFKCVEASSPHRS
jgi:hypothetical protein